MRLTNYWWLLIWVVFVGGVSLIVNLTHEETVLGEREVKWRWLPSLLAVTPLIIWAGFRKDVGDTGLYTALFERMPTSFSEWKSYLNSINKDPGFSILGLIIKRFLGNRSEVYFLIIAVFQGISLAKILRKYSCDYWFSIFVFIASTDYISWMLNGMRQFTAVMIVFSATDWILERKYLRVVLVILLAYTIHGSALLMLPVMFIITGKAWNFRTIASLFVVILILAYVDRFTDIIRDLTADTQYKNVVSDWESWDDDGTNPIRVLVYSIPAILSLVGYRYIRAEDNPIINLSVNASIVSSGLYLVSMVTSGIFIGRLPIFVSLYATGILLPWEIDHMFTENSAKVIKIIAFMAFSAFFYYQMHFSWGML